MTPETILVAGRPNPCLRDQTLTAGGIAAEMRASVIRAPLAPRRPERHVCCFMNYAIMPESVMAELNRIWEVP
jgi:hypothetical protein